ncbi:hypothetical protein BJF81_11285 [Ornithinimicrobium sp. CNJ-824]|nr:hypothetical protein BJF81_11285 [Ornithinimicrobium sp. CNJ-824]
MSSSGVSLCQGSGPSAAGGAPGGTGAGTEGGDPGGGIPSGTCGCVIPRVLLRCGARTLRGEQVVDEAFGLLGGDRYGSERLVGGHDTRLGPAQDVAPAPQGERGLAPFGQVAHEPPDERQPGMVAHAPRLGQQAPLPQALDRVGGKDALGHDDVVRPPLQDVVAGDARAGDVVDGHVRAAVDAELLERGQRRVHVPGAHVVPVDQPQRAHRQVGVGALAVEVVQGDHRPPEARGQPARQPGLAGAAGTGEHEDPRGSGGDGLHGGPV